MWRLRPSIIFCAAVLVLYTMTGIVARADSPVRSSMVLDVPFAPGPAPMPVAGAASRTVDVSAADLRDLHYDWVVSSLAGDLLDMPLPIHFQWQQQAVSASNDIPRTMADGLSGELAAQGYRMGPGHVGIRIDVIRLHEDLPPRPLDVECANSVIPNGYPTFSRAAILVRVVNAAGRLAFVKYYEAG